MLGTVGSSLHQISGQMRKMFSYSIFGLFTFAVLEDVIDDLSEGFRLEWLSDMIYAKKGGMTVTSTIVLAVLLALLPLIADKMNSLYAIYYFSSIASMGEIVERVGLSENFQKLVNKGNKIGTLTSSNVFVSV